MALARVPAQASTNLLAWWVSQLESRSSTLSQPRWHSMEQRSTVSTEMLNFPNCRCFSKVTDCYCFKPLSFGMVCYTAVNNQYTIVIKLLQSMSQCLIQKVCVQTTLWYPLTWERHTLLILNVKKMPVNLSAISSVIFPPIPSTHKIYIFSFHIQS